MSDYWLGTPPRGTSWVPRGSRDLILGSTGSGRPRLYLTIVFPTHPLRSLGFGALGKSKGDSFVCR